MMSIVANFSELVGDDNELERNLKLEKVVYSDQLRLARRRARLENVAATKRLNLAMEMDKERKSRPEKTVATAQLMLALIKSVVNVGVVLSLSLQSLESGQALFLVFFFLFSYVRVLSSAFLSSILQSK